MIPQNSFRYALHLKMFQQSVRNRHFPSPGSLEQRLFREVTKPIYRQPKLSRAEKYLIILEEAQKRAEQNPYRNFLVRQAKKDFYDAADGKMLLIFQPFYTYQWELQPVLNKLNERGFKFRQFPVSILIEAAKGTKWESFADIALRDTLPYRFLFGEADPKLCASVLKIATRARFLALMGGVIGHRMMTRDEIRDYANYGDLPSLHAQLLGTLTDSTSQTANLLGHTGSQLSQLIQWHANSDVETSSSSSDSDSSSSDSDSSSSDSDSSDSDSETII